MEFSVHETGCIAIAGESEALIKCDTTQVVEHLDRYGCIVFRGFNVDVEGFVPFASSFGKCTPVRRAPTSSRPISFHAEDAYNPFRPDALWFHCVEVGSDQGASTYICDGERLYRTLPQRLKNELSGQSIRFDRLYGRAVWRNLTRVESPGELARLLDFVPGLIWRISKDEDLYLGFEAPVISKFGDGRLAFANSMLHAWTEPEFYGMSFSDGTRIPGQLIEEVTQIAQSIETGIQWGKGDIALLDNRRLIHRRGEYFGVGRDLCVTNCENFFGTATIEVPSSNAAEVCRLIQGEVGIPKETGWEVARRLVGLGSAMPPG